MSVSQFTEVESSAAVRLFSATACTLQLNGHKLQDRSPDLLKTTPLISPGKCCKKINRTPIRCPNLILLFHKYLF